MNLKNFYDFIDESYLESNNAPLYHYTSSFSLKRIIKEDTLNCGLYDNIYKGKLLKFVSLTRNKNFLHDYRECDISIELDRDKLIHNYELIPYDFYIHTNKEVYPKSNLKRKERFEFEEIILKNIRNIGSYIISLTFYNLNNYYNIEEHVLEYINTYKHIKIIK